MLSALHYLFLNASVISQLVANLSTNLFSKRIQSGENGKELNEHAHHLEELEGQEQEEELDWKDMELDTLQETQS